MVYKYDKNFIYTQPEFYTHGLEGYTNIAPPDGLFKAKWNPEEQEWQESATQEHIDDQLKNDSDNSDDELDEMQKMQKALAELTISLVRNGVI